MQGSNELENGDGGIFALSGILLHIGGSIALDLLQRRVTDGEEGQRQERYHGDYGDLALGDAYPADVAGKHIQHDSQFYNAVAMIVTPRKLASTRWVASSQCGSLSGGVLEYAAAHLPMRTPMQYRNLPSVDSVLATTEVAEIASSFSRQWVVELVRSELDLARERIRKGEAAADLDEVAALVCRRVDEVVRAEPRRVINATGVVIHTNLGRAPLSRAAMAAAEEAAFGYSNLEFDLKSGRRGSRQAQLESLLCQITGAEAALAVNNNASAVLLGLLALAAEREVIVSRAEAVEIGGGFRVPDVLRQSGATLVDVGTTNRTYLRDYEDATTADTAAYLKVHASNFRVEGFTAEVGMRELAELGDTLGVAVLHDVGSGSLLPTEAYGLAHEPMPQESVGAGMGLVFFSGDKLLGGPQAGIVVGRRDLVSRLARHPLARAVRIDKLSLASLTATLVHYLKGEAEREVPVWRMISASPDDLRQRAEHWRASLSGSYSVCESRSTIGGGSLPGETLPTWVLALDAAGMDGGAQGVMQQLRESRPPVIARVEDERVLFDPRTVAAQEESDLLACLQGLEA